ncbi:SCP-like extracellular protein [Phytophthora infestans T30-4]|uniref:SCP-like extracellular protein n=1 Tax=Phytophthora infestans (strain T30-4) TaxID=403677 RepID=D0NF94_PHYIT|nr:SCP-like extracellular protein [Phytophthora infestans T30-4]EEY56883.1 SCP-like extracellular protein [Phytophthora infestans T30-4]|eukprot:XP_002902211.1 SCP-like extracellular protein [Phytophthora infestans T30-4]
MLARVNQERAAHGLPALCTNKKLQDAAQRHSNDQAASNFMGHTGTDGTSVSERITRANYDWSAVAENVAAGQADVDSVMENWMNSPGHRENILGDYTMLGCAYAHHADTTYQHYWTQDFGSGEAEACDGGVVVTEAIEEAPVEQAPVETVTTSVDVPVTTNRYNTYSYVHAVKDTYAPHTDPPLPYESHKTEAPVYVVETTEAPCTTEPPIVVDPLPYPPSGDVEVTVAPCTASQEPETPVVIVDPPEAFDDATVVEQPEETPVVVVDPPEVTPTPVYKKYGTPSAHIPATGKRPYDEDCDHAG